ncbi:MAG: hypothetical protein JEZ03_11075 [Bacteroidales bacterium]|nr:hypothetical protein [Bacteroidales bacterium]
MTRFILKAIVFVALLVVTQVAAAQEENSGVVSAKIFANYHQQLAEDNSGFELQRAYFGYNKDLGNGFSGFVKLDVGYPDDNNQYAYFKNAGVKYKKDALEVQFGLIDGNTFKIQEGFWGHRYIYKSFMDQHKFGSSADLGTKVAYKFTNWLSADAMVLNGEGYKKPQGDSRYKGTFGVTLNPVDALTVRLYTDYVKSAYSQRTYAAFVGYKYEKLFSVGAEYNMMVNNKYRNDHNLDGISAYALLNATPKLEIFARYDQLASNEFDKNGEMVAWDLAKDGSQIIGGVQYKVHRNVKLALDYQSWTPADGGDSKSFVFLHTEIKL